MDELKTTKAISALMAYRDLLKQQAEAILEPAMKELELAKAKYHAAKINYNQLMKKSQAVQDSITLEMQMQHDEEVKVEEAWEVKGYSEMLEDSNE